MWASGAGLSKSTLAEGEEFFHLGSFESRIEKRFAANLLGLG
jgi:hypothetical protein